MTTPAGLTRFSRVIVSKRDGHCLFCKVETHADNGSYAAVNAAGKWVAVCATCATSLAAQVAGTVRSIEALAAGNEAQVTDALSTTDMDVLAQVLAGTADEATSYTMLTNLFAVRNLIGKALTPRDELVEALRAMAVDATASPRNREFAESLVRWVDGGRALTENQRNAAERMVSRPAGPVAPVENGLYLFDDGSIWKVYTTQNDRTATKVLRVVGNSGSFDYVKGGTRTVSQAVAAGTARKLTQDEAQAFGRQHGFCVNCALDLTDDRSLAAGYGPVCARNNGWFYPNVAEAAAILARPTVVLGSDGQPARHWRDLYRAHND